MGFFDFLFGNNNGSNDNAGKNAQQSKTSTSSNGISLPPKVQHHLLVQQANLKRPLPLIAWKTSMEKVSGLLWTDMKNGQIKDVPVRES